MAFLCASHKTFISSQHFSIMWPVGVQNYLEKRIRWMSRKENVKVSRIEPFMRWKRDMNGEIKNIIHAKRILRSKYYWSRKWKLCCIFNRHNTTQEERCAEGKRVMLKRKKSLKCQQISRGVVTCLKKET